LSPVVVDSVLVCCSVVVVLLRVWLDDDWPNTLFHWSTAQDTQRLLVRATPHDDVIYNKELAPVLAPTRIHRLFAVVVVVCVVFW
jgi:hypothetical protein